MNLGFATEGYRTSCYGTDTQVLTGNVTVLTGNVTVLTGNV